VSETDGIVIVAAAFCEACRSSMAAMRRPRTRDVAAAAKGEALTARTFPNPELTAEPGTRQIQGAEGSRSEFHANFALSQLLECPSKRALKIALSDRDLTTRRLALEGFRFQLSTEVRRAFSKGGVHPVDDLEGKGLHVGGTAFCTRGNRDAAIRRNGMAHRRRGVSLGAVYSRTRAGVAGTASSKDGRSKSSPC
jgi:hypothetical protein